MSSKGVILKNGKDKAIRNRHHWIFSGAIYSLPEFKDGDILPVYSADGKSLGSAYFNKKASIRGRMLSFDEKDPVQAVRQNIRQSIAWRKQIFKDSETNAYRLVNGEGDCLPGLTLDKYNDAIVIQISTLGMDLLKNVIIDTVLETENVKLIYEKSHLPSRREEGLKDVEGVIQGALSGDIEIRENGLRFFVSLTEGQKTGFFLDHREMRQLIRTLSKGKRLLNCFAYTGGFSVYAAAGEAIKVDTVDISDKAIEMAKQNMSLNGFEGEAFGFYTDDVFKFLRDKNLEYDIVVLDPPAFAKKSKDVVAACRGYKDINRIAMQKMPPGSILLTSSCSYYVDEELFQKVVFQASVEANRKAKIIGRHRMAPDHPINLCHPESDYLKSLLIYLE